MCLGVLVALAAVTTACGLGQTRYGDSVADFTIGGSCDRSFSRDAEVELFGSNVVLLFYTPDDFEDCVGGFSWQWTGNFDDGMEQFVAGPCLLGWGVNFPPQNVPEADRAFSSITDDGGGRYTVSGGAGALKDGDGFDICEGPLTVEIRPR